MYVDSKGTPTGETAPKLQAHTANTRIHSAFSCYIFNQDGEFLVTKRAHSKKVWPGVWTNSVCGHVEPGETRENAVRRRTKYELGMEITDLQIILPAYTYKTPLYKGIIENEFCPVYVAMTTDREIINNQEVEATKWMNWETYVNNIQVDYNDTWSWWCKDQLQQSQKSVLFNTFLSGIQQPRKDVNL